MHWRKPVLIVVLLGLCLSLTSSPAFAWDPFESIADGWYSICRDWKRNNCWPEPFVCPDRTTVRMPFCIQIANGWRSRNTLDGIYFEDNGSELSEIGKNRIRYLLMNTPSAYRAIYVLQDCDPALTTARLAAVQTAVNETCGGQIEVPVMLTSSPPDGYGSEEANLVRRKYFEWVADPTKVPRVMGPLDPSSAGVTD